MERLVKVAESVVTAKDNLDDDFADRLSAKVTVYILVAFAILNSLNVYVGKPITCWTPKHFVGAHTKYTNSYCWIQNTYYLPWDEKVPEGGDDTHRQMVTYYQWIPFILLFQAILFYFPTIVWHALNTKTGVDCDSILETAHKLTNTLQAKSREKTLVVLVNQMRRFLGSPRGGAGGCNCSCPPRGCGTCCGTRLGNYLVLLFLFSKLLFIANVVSQFFWLNKLLNFNFNLFGWRFLSGDWRVENHDWTGTHHVAFPRVTMCDIDVRRLGNTHTYAVQCTLPINLFNEKIYLFLWFWFVFVAAVSVFSFLVWVARALIARDRIGFIKNHLKNGGVVETQGDRDVVSPFVRDYLRQDGVFIMRLVAQNADGITCTEFCTELWTQWREERRSRAGGGVETEFQGASPGNGGFPNVSLSNELPGNKTD